MNRRTVRHIHSRTETPFVVEGGIVDGRQRKRQCPFLQNKIVFRHNVNVGAVGGMIVIDGLVAIVSPRCKPRRLIHRLAEFGGIDEFAAHLGGK